MYQLTLIFESILSLILLHNYCFPDNNADIYISSEAPKTGSEADDSLAGGAPTTKQKSGKVLARGKASPSHSISSLSSLALLVFAMIT